MRSQKDNLGALLLASFIVISFSTLLLIVGPRDKKRSKYNSTDWSAKKEKRSLHREILRGEIDKLDTLLMVINKKDTVLQEIPYSRKIKFFIDTLVNSTRRVSLINPVSKKSIKFILLNSKWLGLYRKEFWGMEMY